MFNPPNELSGLVDWNDLYSHPPFVEEWLAYPVVPKGRLISLYGPAKVGKSLFVLELAASVATGRDFLGLPTIKSRVLYIDRENDPYRDVLERLKHMGFCAEELDGNLFYLSYPSMDDFDTQSGAKTILNWVDNHNVDFVIVDTISRFIQGKENENDTWREVYKLTGQELKKRGTTFLRIDHSGKDLSKGARGGSAKEQDADITWSLSKPKKNPFVLNADSNRMPIEVEELKLVLNHEPLRFDWSDSQENNTEEVRIKKMVESLDKAGLPRTASIDKTEKFIRNDLNGHMGRDTVSKVVRVRKSDSLPKPSWSTEEYFQPPHQLTEEDLLQSEHNAFHAKRRSAPKMEREWFGSFHEEDTTDWNDSESDHYPNEW
jgi:hypothetical protein